MRILHIRIQTPHLEKRIAERQHTLCKSMSRTISRTMTQNWAGNQRNDKYCSSRPEEQNTISIIQDLLDKVITPVPAAHGIAAIYEPRISKGERISVYLFSLLSRAIIYPTTTLENYQDIIQTLINLSKLPEVIVDGRQLKENGRIYWRDIPEFSFWFSEEALRKCSTPPILQQKLIQTLQMFTPSTT